MAKHEVITHPSSGSRARSSEIDSRQQSRAACELARTVRPPSSFLGVACAPGDVRLAPTRRNPGLTGWLTWESR